MDRESSKAEQVRQLTAAAAAARGALRADVITLRHKLDVPARVKGSLKLHPGGWLIGALGAGFAASLLLRGRSHQAGPKRKRGILGMLLGLALTALRPFAKVWLTDQLKSYLAAQVRGFGPHVGQSPAVRRSNPL